MSLANIYNRVQLYSENTNIKYPVEDRCTEPIPFDCLVDAAVSVPAAMARTGVRITNLIRTPAFVFMSLESGEEPVGHVLVTGPAAFRAYPLTMSAEGTGWVVFGPGVQEPLDLKGISAQLDPRCILPAVGGGIQFKLRVNGVEHDMPNILTVRTNYFLRQAIEARTHDLEPDSPATATGPCAVLGRNDLVLDENLLKYGMVDRDFTDLPLFSIGGVDPDAAGNLDIELAAAEEASSQSSSSGLSSVEVGGELLPITSPSGVEPVLGLLFRTDPGVEACPDPYRDLRAKIKKGKAGHGTAYDLPMDPYVDDWDRPFHAGSSTSSTSSVP